MKRNKLNVSGNVPCEACGGMVYALLTSDSGTVMVCMTCDEVRILQAALANPDQPPSLGQKLDLLLVMVRKLLQQGEKFLATEDDVLAEVAKQTTLVTSLQAFITSLKAASGDPAKLQAILDGISANDLTLAAVQNTPAAGAPTGATPPVGGSASAPGGAAPGGAPSNP